MRVLFPLPAQPMTRRCLTASPSGKFRMAQNIKRSSKLRADESNSRGTGAPVAVTRFGSANKLQKDRSSGTATVCGGGSLRRLQNDGALFSLLFNQFSQSGLAEPGGRNLSRTQERPPQWLLSYTGYNGKGCKRQT